MRKRSIPSFLAVIATGVMFTTAIPVQGVAYGATQSTAQTQMTLPVLNVTPANGATGVRPDAPITIVLDPNNSNFTRFRQQFVNGSFVVTLNQTTVQGTYNPSTYTITVDHPVLSRHTSYTLTLTTKAMANSSTTQPGNASFTTTFTTGSNIDEATHLTAVVKQSPVPVTQGGELDVSVTDDYGDPATNATVTVTGDSANFNAQTVAVTNGQAQIPLVDQKAETVNLKVTSQDQNSGATQTQTGLSEQFVAGPTQSISLSPAANSVIVAQSLQVTGIATDVYGNPVADGTVISLAAQGGTVPQSVKTTNGQFSFTYTAGTKSGSGSVTATDASTSATSQALITLNPGVPAEVILTPVSTAITAGDPDTINGTVTDQYGNPVADGTHVALTSSEGSVPASVTTTGGQFSFTLTDATKAGSVSLTATTDNAIKTSTSVTVNPGAPHVITATPANGQLTAGDSYTISGEVKDQYGNPVADGTQLTWTTDAGSTPQSHSVTTSNGAYSFNLTDDPAADQIAGDHLITITAANGTSTTATVNVQPGAPAHIVFDQTSSSVTAGKTDALTGTVTDQFGNPVQNGTPITITSTGTSGDVPASVSTVNGTFTVNFTDTKAGTYTVTASAGNNVTTAESVTVTPDVPAKVTLTPASASVTAGTADAFSGTVKDQYGNPVADGTSVTLTATLNGATVDSVTTQTSGGQFSYTLSRDLDHAAGQYTVTANSGNAPAAAAVIEVKPGDPAHISFAPDNSEVTAGQLITFTGAVTDEYNNPVTNGTIINLSLGSSYGTVPVSVLTTDGGAISFQLTNDTKAGTYTVTAAAENSTAANPVTYSETVTVDPGQAQNVTLSSTNPSVVAGNDNTFTGTVTDAFLNPVADGTSVTVVVKLGDTLVDTYLTTTTGGSFSYTLPAGKDHTAGTYTVTATTGNGAQSSPVSLQVNPDVPANINITPASTKITAGNSVSYTATVRDQYGNLVADGTPVAVTATEGDPISGLTTVNGQVSFTLHNATTAGNVVVTITAGSVSQTASVQVAPAAAHTVTVTPAKTEITAGDSVSVTVTVQDAYGNNVADGTNMTLSAGTGSVPQTETTTNGSFTFTLDKATLAGTDTVTVTADNGVAGSAGIQVDPGAPEAIVLTPASTSITAGQLDVITGTVVDAYGNNVADNTVVNLSTNHGSVPASVVTNGGQISFTLADATWAGSYTLTATAADNASATSTLQITVSPGDPASITAAAASVAVTAGQAQVVSGKVKDQYGNAVTDGTPVTVTIAHGTTDKTYTVTTTNGSYLLTVPGTDTETAGQYTVSASVGTLESNSSTFIVKPGTPANITLTPSSASVQAGVGVDFSGTVTDQFGNNVADGTMVTLSTTGGFVPAGTMTTGGAFTFSLSEDTVAGNYAITAQAGTNATQTANVTVNPGDAASISLSGTGILSAGGSDTLTGTVFDQYGNTVQNGTVVNLSVSGPANATVPASVSTTAGGQITFTFTGADKIGTYVITASTSSGASTTFNEVVTPGLAANLTLSAVSPSVQVTNPDTITAVVTDAYGNPVQDGTTVTFGSDSGSLSETSGSTLNGQVSFTFTAGTASGTATVTASVGSIASSSTLTVLPGPTYTVVLTPENPQVGPGDTTQIDGYAVDEYGNRVLAGKPVAVTTSDAGGSVGAGNITTDSNGAFTFSYTAGTTAGTDMVTAAVDGISGSADVTVEPGQPARIDLSAATTTVQVGQTDTITGTVYDSYGNLVADGTTVTLTSSGGQVVGSATTSNGAFTVDFTAGDTPGAGSVMATANGVQGIATMTVVPGYVSTLTLTPASSKVLAGQSVLVTGTAVDQYGNPVAQGTVISLVAAGGTVPTTTTTNSDGSFSFTFTAGSSAGAASVTASANGVSQSASITVEQLEPANITLTPSTDSVQAGTTVTYTGTVTDQYGNPIADGTVVNLTSSSNNLQLPASVTTTNGSFTFAATNPTVAGNYTITAQTANGVNTTAALTITPAAVASITLTPQTDTVTAGGSAITYSGVVKDAYNNPISGAVVTLQKSGGDGTMPTTAKTGSDGSYSFTLSGYTKAGTFTITTSTGGQSASATLTVSPAAAATFTIQASPTAITKGNGNGNDWTSSTISGTVKDQYGNTVANGTTVALTASASPGTATLSPSAPTTVSGSYSSTLTFSEGGNNNTSGTITVTATVSGLPPKSVTITVTAK